MSEQLEVLWPLGKSAAAHLVMSPRLQGRGPFRFGFMWGYTFRGDELFPLIQAGLAERLKSRSPAGS